MTNRDGGVLSESTIAALVGIAVYVLMRLADTLLPPKGRHLKWWDRWTVSDKEPPNPEDEKG